MSFVLFHFVWGHMFARNRNDAGVQESLSKSLNQATFHIAIPLATFPYLPPPWFVDVAWRRTTCVHLSWHYQKNTRSSTTLFQQRALDPCHIYDTRRSAAPHIKNCSGSLQIYSTLLQHWWDSLLSGNCPGFNYSCSPHGCLWNTTLSSSHACVKIVI